MNKILMNECSKRRLDELYVVVYAIKNEINIKKADYIEKTIIYTLVGIDTKGYRQLIDVYQDRIYMRDFGNVVAFNTTEENEARKNAEKV